MSTGIQWTDATWNPVTGCQRVSAGCANCYAQALHNMRYRKNVKAAVDFNETFADDPLRVNVRELIPLLRKNDWARGAEEPAWLPFPQQYDTPFAVVQTWEHKLLEPLKWRKPKRVFVNSMSDLFHEDVPDEFLDRVFAVMALTPHITYQVLTKRPERMRAYVSESGTRERVWREMKWIRPSVAPPPRHWYHASRFVTWPLPNVWLGVSVEDQAAADTRIPELLATPAAVRFLSCEPLMGRVDLQLGEVVDWAPCWSCGGARETVVCVDDLCHGAGECFHGDGMAPCRECEGEGELPEFQRDRDIGWVIVGGESGAKARPCNVEWVRDIVRQCQAAGVAVFVKQLGSRAYAGIESEPTEWSRLKLRHNHGGNPDEWPADLRVREFAGVTG